MRLPQCVLVCAAMLAGCKGCDKNSDEPPPMPSAPATASAPPTPVELPTAEPAEEGVVRPELDNRSDGVKGTLVTVTGANANVNVPTDWKVTKGTEQVAASGDQKLRLAMTFYGAEPASGKLEKLAAASGLTECTWQPPQTLTVGKDKLSTEAADGKCKKGGVPVAAAYIATEGYVALGSWDDGTDRKPLFDAMRSVAKQGAGGTRVSKLVACCRVLAQNAKSAPPMQAPFLLQAAATCESAALKTDTAAIEAAIAKFCK